MYNGREKERASEREGAASSHFSVRYNRIHGENPLGAQRVGNTPATPTRPEQRPNGSFLPARAVATPRARTHTPHETCTCTSRCIIIITTMVIMILLFDKRGYAYRV